MKEALSKVAPSQHPYLVMLGKGFFAKDEENPDFIRVVVRKKSDFVADSLRLVVVDDSSKVVSAIIGVVKSSKVKTDIYAFRFAKKDFDADSAQEWVAKKYSAD